MVTHAGRLLEQRDTVVETLLVAELLEANGRGKARWTTANDEQVRGLVCKPVHVDAFPAWVFGAVLLLVVRCYDARSQRGCT